MYCNLGNKLQRNLTQNETIFFLKCVFYIRKLPNFCKMSAYRLRPRDISKRYHIQAMTTFISIMICHINVCVLSLTGLGTYTNVCVLVISALHCIIEGKCYICLTHWGCDKMVAIFKTTFSNGFSWMRMYEFRLTFHWSLFLGVHGPLFQYWFR